MTYPVRLQETYWLPFVETNITLCGGLIRSPFAVHAHVRCRRLRLHSPFNGRVRVFSLATERTRERLREVCAFRGGQTLREQSARFPEPTLERQARGSLVLLARGPEQDLVHIHLLRLAHGEGDGPRK